DEATCLPSDFEPASASVSVGAAVNSEEVRFDLDIDNVVLSDEPELEEAPFFIRLRAVDLDGSLTINGEVAFAVTGTLEADVETPGANVKLTFFDEEYTLAELVELYMSPLVD